MYRRIKRKYFQLTLIGIVALSSCTTTKLLTSDVQPSQIAELPYLEPYSYISLIEKGNRGTLNAWMSENHEQLLASVTDSCRSLIAIPPGERIILDDSLRRQAIRNEVESLVTTAMQQRQLNNLRIGRELDMLLEEQGKRFVLILVSTGFTRAKGNYGGQIAKGLAIGILTLGTYYQTPVKSNSNVYAMIVDGERNEVAFFRRSYLQDKDPFDRKVLSGQLHQLFEGYFYHKNGDGDSVYN